MSGRITFSNLPSENKPSNIIQEFNQPTDKMTISELRCYYKKAVNQCLEKSDIAEAKRLVSKYVSELINRYRSAKQHGKSALMQRIEYELAQLPFNFSKVISGISGTADRLLVAFRSKSEASAAEEVINTVEMLSAVANKITWETDINVRRKQESYQEFVKLYVKYNEQIWQSSNLSELFQ